MEGLGRDVEISQVTLRSFDIALWQNTDAFLAASGGAHKNFIAVFLLQSQLHAWQIAVRTNRAMTLNSSRVSLHLA